MCLEKRSLFIDDMAKTAAIDCALISLHRDRFEIVGGSQ